MVWETCEGHLTLLHECDTWIPEDNVRKIYMLLSVSLVHEEIIFLEHSWSFTPSITTLYYSEPSSNMVNGWQCWKNKF